LVKPRENQWDFRSNDVSRKIKQFLRFTEYSPDEILNLDTKDIEKYLVKYAESIRYVNTYSVRENKIESVISFFEVNGIIFKDYEEELFIPPRYTC